MAFLANHLFLLMTASKPVSIEIKGDNLVVVTEPCPVAQADPNINCNENKFETSSSQSATDMDNTSLSSNSTNQSPSSFQTQTSVVDGDDGSDSLPKPHQLQRVSVWLVGFHVLHFHYYDGLRVFLTSLDQNKLLESKISGKTKS